MTHREGVYATSALFEAGDRPELTVSEPNPKAAKLAAVLVLANCISVTIIVIPVDVPDPFDEPELNAAVR